MGLMKPLPLVTFYLYIPSATRGSLPNIFLLIYICVVINEILSYLPKLLEECYMLKQSVTRAKVVMISTLGMKILTKFKQAFSV